MLGTRRRPICIVVGAALLCILILGPGRTLLAELMAGKVAPEATEYKQFVVVKPQELKGTVWYPDGKTFAAGVPVRVWSVELKNFVHETDTDENGAYTLPKLAPGRYLVCFADRVVVELRVEEAAESAASQLDVLIPHGKGAFAQMAPAQKTVALMVFAATEEDAGRDGAGEARLLRTVLIGAGGIGTAVAVLAVTDNLGDDDKKIVSP